MNRHWFRDSHHSEHGHRKHDHKKHSHEKHGHKNLAASTVTASSVAIAKRTPRVRYRLYGSIALCLSLVLSSLAATTPAAAAQVDVSASTKIHRLYSAYFDRVADPAGHAYWTDLHNGGNTNLDDISQYFSESHEFQTNYGVVGNHNFVSLVYRNVMKRTPDRQGYDYWISQLDTGSITRGELMNLFAQSLEYSNRIDRQRVPYDPAAIPSIGHENTHPELYWACRTDYSRANCKITEGSKRVLMVGDSFTARMFPAIYQLALENGWELHYLVVEGCPWALNVSRSGHTDCTESKWKVAETIRQVRPEITLYTNFPYEKHGESSRLSGQWPLPADQYSDVVDPPTGNALTEQQLADAMKAAARWTRDVSGGEVILIEPAPVIASFDGMQCAQSATSWDACDFKMINYDTDTQRQLKAYAENNTGIFYTSFNNWFCTGPNCVGVIHGHSLLEDRIHMNSQVFLGHKSQILNNLRSTGANL